MSQICEESEASLRLSVSLAFPTVSANFTRF